MKKKWMNLTLRQKLIMLFVVTSCFIVIVNLSTYASVSEMLRRVEKVYTSNVSLNDLSDGLDALQTATTDYLQTKSSDAMERYYRCEQEYRDLLEMLNRKATDNEILLTEKNIT